MSDQPRHHWLARNPDGTRLGAAARDLCSYLWTFLSGRSRVQQTGGFVWHTAERLALELEVDKRTIERQLQQLRTAGLLRSGVDEANRPGFFMLVLTPKRSEIADRSGGSERQNDRRSPIVLAEIADRSGGDRRSFCRPLKEEQDQEQEVKQEREQDLTQARALAAASSVPDGAPPLGTSRPALYNLLALLAAGEDPDLVGRVLRRAADIVTAGFESAAYFGADMFVGRVWTHWCRSLFELERNEQADAAKRAHQAATAATAEAEQQAQAELAAREAERHAVAHLYDRAKRAQGRSAPDVLTGLLAERDAFEAALAYAPDAALEAMDRVRTELGEGVTEAAIRAAVVALEVKPPTRRSVTPADLRAARERADREGRSPLDVLDEGARQ